MSESKGTYDCRGQRLSPVSAGKLSVSILMPSGMSSTPHEFSDHEAAMKLATSFLSQMKAWKDFEAWILLIEDGKEISREHVRT